MVAVMEKAARRAVGTWLGARMSWRGEDVVAMALMGMAARRAAGTWLGARMSVNGDDVVALMGKAA